MDCWGKPGNDVMGARQQRGGATRRRTLDDAIGGSIAKAPTRILAASRCREIQLHADAVGIVKKELRVSGSRHDLFAEFYVF
jgi:hypothetical protein